MSLPTSDWAAVLNLKHERLFTTGLKNWDVGLWSILFRCWVGEEHPTACDLLPKCIKYSSVPNHTPSKKSSLGFPEVQFHLLSLLFIYFKCFQLDVDADVSTQRLPINASQRPGSRQSIAISMERLILSEAFPPPHACAVSGYRFLSGFNQEYSASKLCCQRRW